MKTTGEHLLRELAPLVLGAVVRRYGDFGAAEDAVQEALTAAALQWPRTGVPEDPRAWLLQVAARKLTDQIRSESARRRRETKLVLETSPEEHVVPPPDEAPVDEDAHGKTAMRAPVRAAGGLAGVSVVQAVPSNVWVELRAPGAHPPKIMTLPS